MKLDASDIADLEPIIAAAVRDTLANIQANWLQSLERLAFHEPEAATLCGIERHALRDARRRGEIEASKLGGRICYTRESLVTWIAQQRCGR